VDVEVVKAKLARSNVYHIVHRPGPDASLFMEYFAARGMDVMGNASGSALYVELTFKAGFPAVKVVVKAENHDLGKLGAASLVKLLQAA
jgi:hypothetical protein